MIRRSIFHLAVALGFLLGLPGGFASAWEPVRAHPQNPHILEFRGKPTLLWNYGATYDWMFDFSLDYISYLDVLQRDGMNLVRVWCFAFPLFDAADMVQPWPRSTANGNALGGLGKWDFSAWDTAYFDRLRGFAQAAGDRGIVVEYTLFSVFYTDSEWEESPFHPANNVQGYGPNNRHDCLRPVDGNLLAVQKAAVRRIVSELNGFDNVYFEIQNEPFWNQPGVKDAEEAGFHDTMLSEIRAEEAGLPNKHLVAHNYPQQLATMSTGFDIINEHYPIPVPGATIAGAEALLANHYSRGKILALDETNTFTELQTRLEAWMFFIGGGAIYNGLDGEEAVYSPEDPSGDNALGSAIRQTVRNIGSYMNRMYLLGLRRNLSWVTGGIPSGATLQASAIPDLQYVAYLHHGKKTAGQNFQLHYDPISTSDHNVSLRVNLEPGEWRAVWTRPFDLAELHVQEFAHSGGNITLQQVTCQADVALRIDRITPPPPPSGLGGESNADGSITLSWDPALIPYLAGYHVYRSGLPEVPVDAGHRITELPVSGTGFTDSPEVPNTTYYYVMTAVDQAGNEWPVTFEAGFASIFPKQLLFVDAAGQHVLEWSTPFPGWFLQESPDLSPDSWTDCLHVPVVAGDRHQVVIDTAPQRRFFRLAYRPPEPAP